MLKSYSKIRSHCSLCNPQFPKSFTQLADGEPQKTRLKILNRSTTLFPRQQQFFIVERRKKWSCRVQNCSKWPHHEEITMTLTYEDERIASLLNSNSAGVGAILFFFLCFHSFCCFLLNVFRPTALFHGNMHWRCIGVAVIWLCLVLCMAKSKMRSKRRQT